MKRWIIIIFMLLLLLTAFAAGEEIYPAEDEKSGKWGYTDESGQWIIPASFAWAERFRGEYAHVTMISDSADPDKAGKYTEYGGIINRRGEFVLPAEYNVDTGWEDGMSGYGSWENGYYVVRTGSENNPEDGPEGFFDIRSGFFSGLKYEYVWPAWGDEGDLIPIAEEREDELYLGYADRTTGEMVLPCEYYLDWTEGAVTTFPEGIGVVWKLVKTDEGENKAIPVMMNRDGEEISLPEGITACEWSSMSDGLIVVCDQDEMYGYADREGNIVIAPQYTDAYDFSDGEALVERPNDGWALINTRGEILREEGDEEFPVLLSETEAGKPCYAVHNEQGLYGYIDSRGRMVMPYQFADAEDFRGSYAKVEVKPRISNDESWEGMINDRGEWVFKPGSTLRIESDLSSWSLRGDSFIGGKQDGIFIIGTIKWNEEKGDTEYKSGFLDVRNGFFTGFIYDDVKVDIFSSGAWDYSELIPVVMNWKMGFARRENGEIVIPCKYEPSGSEGFLRYGYAEVTSGEDGRLLQLDRDGKEICPPDDAIFDPDVGWPGDGMFPARSRENKLFGYVNMDGQWVLPPKYQFATGFSNGYAEVCYPGEAWIWIDTEGTPQGKNREFISDDIYFVQSGDSLDFYRADHTELYSVSRPGICNCLGFSENGVGWYEIREPGETPSYRAGLMNDRGQVLTEPVFRLVKYSDHDFREGLSPAADAETGLAGFVDETGEWVIEPVFDSTFIGAFRDGAAWVIRNEQRLLIDKEGNILFAEPVREDEGGDG